MSRVLAATPVSSPSALRMPAIPIETGMRAPDLVSRTLSK